MNSRLDGFSGGGKPSQIQITEAQASYSGFTEILILVLKLYMGGGRTSVMILQNKVKPKSIQGRTKGPVARSRAHI